MALTSEEIKELKSQLASQIKNLPKEQQEAAQAQINSLSPEALESMLKEQRGKNQQSIFRSIVSGEMDSVKIGENSHTIAVLDINPISRGHCIIIPKNPVQKVPKEAYDLAADLSKKIISNLKARETKAFPSSQFGESILHLIPIYENSLTLDSPRTKSSTSDLEKIKQSLETIKIDKKPILIKKNKPRGRKQKPIVLKRKIP